ncbi:hypothetical protein [Parendozoicomonas sp. Alg238-R29]|uniref:hypothetical protein n=1 Tax=Parendozoicomonas sp. Alg238-R29 TaxID=2993446 RepID=UPI00248D89F8|nr:hypothetical protein [Parendozoicomonas sp. Alg238-R29]
MEALEIQAQGKNVDLRQAIFQQLIQSRYIKPNKKSEYESLWKNVTLATPPAKDTPPTGEATAAGTKKTTDSVKLNYLPPTAYLGTDGIDEDAIVQDQVNASFSSADTRNRLGVSVYRVTPVPGHGFQQYAYDIARVLTETNSSINPLGASEAIGRLPGIQPVPGNIVAVGDGFIGGSNQTSASASDVQQIRSEVKQQIQSETHQIWRNILTSLPLCSSTTLNADACVVVDGQVMARVLLESGSIIAKNKTENYANQSPCRVVLAMTSQTARQFISSKKGDLDIQKMIDNKNITLLTTGTGIDDDQLKSTMLTAIKVHTSIDLEGREKENVDEVFAGAHFLGGAVDKNKLPPQLRLLFEEAQTSQKPQ